MKKINVTSKKNTYLKAAWIGLAVLWIWYLIVSVFVLQNKGLLENVFTKNNDLCQNSGCQNKLCSDSICFDIEYAATPPERQKWLMYRENMPELIGMLFVFERPWLLQFWMKNTLLVLDMIRLDDTYKITYIAKDVQPCPPELWDGCPTYWPTFPARYVFEVNGWMTNKYDIKVGDVMRKY